MDEAEPYPILGVGRAQGGDVYKFVVVGSSSISYGTGPSAVTPIKLNCARVAGPAS